MRVRLLAATALAALVAAPAGLADGDPASDFLPARDVFLSFSEGSSFTSGGKQLIDAVTKANQAGYRIKVAVIATPTDLGAVGGLFGEPQRYAEFLGQELTFVYKGRLLIAMPAGLGVSQGGKPALAEAKVLRDVKVSASDVSALDASAARAVAALASAGGTTIEAAGGGGSSSAWYSSAWFLALVAACTAVAIGAGFLFGRRWLERVSQEGDHDDPGDGGDAQREQRGAEA
jgi:hypothetical protein